MSSSASPSSLSRKVPSINWAKWTSLLKRNTLTLQDRRVIVNALLAGGIGGGLLALLRAVWIDYQAYRSYGPGGLPYNLWGWFLSSIVLRPLSTNVLTTDLYDKSPDKRSWLPDDWPKGDVGGQRGGPRPRLGSHPLPQRQVDQLATGDIQQKLTLSFRNLVTDNPSLIQLKPSVHEGHTDAVFLADTVTDLSPIAEEMLKEVAHIHGTGDHSVHVVLAPQDCKKVIESGWGQRHPLDGVRVAKLVLGFSLPKEYILVYAPRTEEEIGLVMEVVKASVGFMTGSREIVG